MTERLAEDRTITGAEQEKWLLDGFKNSTQRWDILGPGLLRGDGGSTTDPVMASNPDLKFYNDNRGYVTTSIAKDALTADFRVLDHVTTPDAPVFTKASFEIPDGVPGLVVRR